jgi:hypothetical protein
MTTQAASQFIQKIFEDEGVRNQITGQVGDITHIDLSGDANAGNTFVRIGSENGYNFNVAELQQAYQSFLEQQAGFGELGSRELESVAGGRAKAEPLCTNTICEETC